MTTPARRDPDAETWLRDVTARDPVLGHLLPDLQRLASNDTPVLLVGEPASGRELAARAIHNLSRRAAGPFVVIDCADASEQVLEAELLGVDTGAPPRKLGAFEQATGGTLLLAEVGELAPRLQEAVLRLIDRQEAVRLYSEAPIGINARCVASTSIDLASRVAGGLFREDLHARFASQTLRLPPLRERPDDIGVLARHFLQTCRLPRVPRGFTPETDAILRAYAWPGNLHELRETVEEAALHARNERISVNDLPARVREAVRAASARLGDVEMLHIERVLEQAHGNQRQAARVLGISRWALARRLRKYGLVPHRTSA